MHGPLQGPVQRSALPAGLFYVTSKQFSETILNTSIYGYLAVRLCPCVLRLQRHLLRSMHPHPLCALTITSSL